MAQQSKPSVLVDLIAVYGKGQKSIVFTQTKRECDEVAANLGRQFAAEALHGDIAQVCAFQLFAFPQALAAVVCALPHPCPSVPVRY